MKAKDYLGKARLVAAADRADAFTGFTGSEIKKQQQEGEAPKDDRPIHNISWAATNLVKPDLIRNRESMPPPPAKEATGVIGGSGGAGGNAYPPTPPPELRAASSARANSVRGGGGGPQRRDDRRDDRDQDRERERDNGYRDDYSPPGRKGSLRDEPPRRAASSASRRTPSRSNTQSSARRRNDRPLDSYSEQDGEYDDELYDMYHDPPRRSNTTNVRRGPSTRRSNSRARYDDDYDASDAYEGSSLDEDEFEMLDQRVTRSSSRRQPPPPQVKRLKVKCHHEDDTRMIMVDVDVEFHEFLSRLQEKFGIRSRIRVKVRDEDDRDCLIGLADQEDLDNAVEISCKAARQERQEVGKLEVSPLCADTVPVDPQLTIGIDLGEGVLIDANRRRCFGIRVFFEFLTRRISSAVDSSTLFPLFLVYDMYDRWVYEFSLVPELELRHDGIGGLMEY